MLVLTRKSNESIQIGQGITVTVLSIRGGHIRLGVEAPQQVPVRRSELSQSPPSAALTAGRRSALPRQWAAS